MSYIPLVEVAKEDSLKTPEPNNPANDKIRDVIGSKADNVLGNSIVSMLLSVQKYFHNVSRVYPNLANSLSITKVNNSAWGLDADTTTLIPANTITGIFGIHFINFTVFNNNDEFQLNLYQGDVGSEILIAEVTFDKSADQTTEPNVSCGTLPIPANSRISGKLSSKAASSRTIGFKFGYHLY
jgi:hypothetical protein